MLEHAFTPFMGRRAAICSCSVAVRFCLPGVRPDFAEPPMGVARASTAAAVEARRDLHAMAQIREESRAFLAQGPYG
jgi:hypothetical protein